MNAVDYYGNTALMKAAEHGEAETVKLLIAAGADVNAKTDDGRTALWFAGVMGRNDIYDILKTAGTEDTEIPKSGI